MKCDLCGKSTYVYTGYLNPWYECGECGAEYCDRCSRGKTPESGYASPADLHTLSNSKVCPRCGSRVSKK